MRNLLKRIKTNSILTAIIYTLLGLVLLVWPALSANVLCTALGLTLVLCGAVDVVIFLFNRDGSLYAGFHLVFGIILIAVGLWLTASPALIAVLIPRILGILICIHGVSDVGHAITLQRGGDGRWGLALALGLVTLALGGVLVFNPFQAFTTVVRVIGAFLVYDGLSDIWIAARVSKVVKQTAEKQSAQQPDPAAAVDVEFHDAEDK
ncbi:MAG: DUF308 domain-containing protein [Oscillibacter sp.]